MSLKMSVMFFLQDFGWLDGWWVVGWLIGWLVTWLVGWFFRSMYSHKHYGSLIGAILVPSAQE